MEIINATDGYKLGHHRMYPEGTQMVYSNWTPRSNRYFPEATEGSVVFGIQYFVKKYLIEEFNKWFALPKERLNIAVTHMVNLKGIKNLSENFNHVWFTNSYKDWDNLPENVTMFKVI